MHIMFTPSGRIEYFDRILSLPSQDDALNEFFKFVDACYKLNGIDPPQPDKFFCVFCTDLVEHVFSEFMFSEGVVDTVKPIRYFKAWRWLAQHNYFPTRESGAASKEFIHTAVTTIIKITNP